MSPSLEHSGLSLSLFIYFPPFLRVFGIGLGLDEVVGAVVVAGPGPVVLGGAGARLPVRLEFGLVLLAALHVWSEGRETYVFT